MFYKVLNEIHVSSCFLMLLKLFALRELRLRPAIAKMQIFRGCARQRDFKETDQIEVFEMGSQALHVIEFITMKLFSVVC